MSPNNSSIILTDDSTNIPEGNGEPQENVPFSQDDSTIRKEENGGIFLKNIQVISEEEYLTLLRNNQVLPLEGNDTEKGGNGTDVSNNIQDENLTQENNDRCKTREKIHYCFFCKKKIDKLSNHLRHNHLNEDIVKRIHSEKNPSKKRNLMTRLTREGDFLRFQMMARVNMDEKIGVRKCRKENQLLKVCPRCHGFFSKQLFTRHVKRCMKSKMKASECSDLRKESNFISASAKLDNVEDIDDYLKNIICCMNDDYREVCSKDPGIFGLGRLLYQPTKPRTHPNLRWKLRLLAKVKFLLQEKANQAVEKNLTDLFTVNNFDAVCSHVQEESKNTPSTAIAYGEIFSELLGFMEADAVRKTQNQDSDVRAEGKKNLKAVEAIKKIFQIEWKKKITRQARYAQKVNKLSIEDVFPVADDIKKFNAGLTAEMAIAASLLKEEKSPENWKNLCRLLLVKITAFNARRPLEPGLMELKRFEKRTRGANAGTDLIHMLTASEKIIAKSMDIVKVIGKHGRIVPILLTPHFVENIQLLNETRAVCGVHAENPFIFPQGKENSLHGGRITIHTVKTLAEKYNLEKPKLITAKQFRRVLASSIQYLNLMNADIENVCNHLGHDMRTHLNFYRLNTEAAELAKVSKILLLLDSGNLEQFSGKSLEEIEFPMNGRSLIVLLEK